jgi:hypothetical protein
VRVRKIVRSTAMMSGIPSAVVVLTAESAAMVVEQRRIAQLLRARRSASVPVRIMTTRMYRLVQRRRLRGPRWRAKRPLALGRKRKAVMRSRKQLRHDCDWKPVSSWSWWSIKTDSILTNNEASGEVALVELGADAIVTWHALRFELS